MSFAREHIIFSSLINKHLNLITPLVSGQSSTHCLLSLVPNSLSQPQRRHSLPFPSFQTTPSLPPLILLPPPPTPHTSKKARHRLIRTPNLHLPKIRHRAITLFIRAHHTNFLAMLIPFCAAEHVFGGLSREIFLLVVGPVEWEGVGTGAAGEVVRS